MAARTRISPSPKVAKPPTHADEKKSGKTGARRSTKYRTGNGKAQAKNAHLLPWSTPVITELFGAERDKWLPKPWERCLEAALSYVAEYGWKVFPGKIVGKTKKSHIAGKNGDGSDNWGMTDDPEQVRRDFKHFRPKCVGVPTGAVNGIFDIEADTKKGHGVDGLANLEALEAKHGKLPDTLMAESPSGSVHRIYNHPSNGIKITTVANKIAKGVDIKGDGGMFIAPPSVRKDSAYRWLNDLPIANAPAWLLGLICEQSSSTRSDGEKNWAEQYGNNYEPPSVEKVKTALAVAFPDGADVNYLTYVAVGHEIKDWDATDEVGWPIFNGWAKTWPGEKGKTYNERYHRKKWEGFRPTETNIGALFNRATAKSPGWWARAQEEQEQKREEDEVGEVSIKPYDFPDEETLERYDWLLGRHLLRGEVAGSVAPGGTGKSSQSIVEALAMASGKQLTHDTVPAHPLRVVLINLEDKRNTMDKRIAAAMKLHKLKKEDIGDRLIVLAKGDIKIKIAKQLHTGSVARSEKTIAALTNLMIKHKADVLSIDSFIRTHSVGENDNSAIQEVVECFEDIAAAANCGVHLWHHTRKGDGEGATVESSRGAKAFIDACRSVRVFETMMEKQGEKLKVENHRQYFRVFSGKRNFAPHVENSNWYHIESVQLMNGPPNYTLEGDNIGAIERWELPTIAEPTSEDIAKIEEAIKSGQWREDVRAAMWVGKAIASVLNLDPDTQKEQIKAFIKKLLREHVLRAVAGKTSDRKDCIFIVPEVDEGAPVA